MKLSARSRYATRLLLELAQQATDKPTRTAILSERTGITVQFIEQIIRPLKKAGLIRSVRGAAGGHFLNKSPHEITIGHVVRATEGPINIVNCIECKDECERSDSCLTRTVWERASRAMEQELDSITLSELLEPSDPTSNPV